MLYITIGTRLCLACQAAVGDIFLMHLEVAGMENLRATAALAAWVQGLGYRVVEHPGYIEIQETAWPWRAGLENGDARSGIRLDMRTSFRVRPNDSSIDGLKSLVNRLNRLEGHCQFCVKDDQLLIVRHSFLTLGRLSPYQFFGYVSTADAIIDHVFGNPMHHESLKQWLF
jgi:hypothetical protein